MLAQYSAAPSPKQEAQRIARASSLSTDSGIIKAGG